MVQPKIHFQRIESFFYRFMSPPTSYLGAQTHCMGPKGETRANCGLAFTARMRVQWRMECH